MAHNLGRRFQYLDLPGDTIAAMLQPAFPVREVLSVERLSAGAINTNLKVTMSGLSGAYVLRIYARDAAACRKEIAINRLAGCRAYIR